MTSLVEELQKDALNHNIKITELLQKSLVVSVKLKIDEFSSWARMELDGYGDDDDIPSYRILHGSVKVFDPYRGHHLLEFESIDHVEQFSNMHFNTPIGQIEYEVNDAQKSTSGAFLVSFSKETEEMLMNAMEFSLKPSLYLSASKFQSIIDAIRLIILEWSLALESDGIMGEGLSFTAEEKTIARGDTYHIKNYIKGDIQDSQIQIEATNSTQNKTIKFDSDKLVELITALRDTLNVIGLDENKSQELNADINTIEVQLSSSNKKHSIIGESLSSIKTILESASGNLVANGMLHQMGVLFGI